MTRTRRRVGVVALFVSAALVVALLALRPWRARDGARASSSAYGSTATAGAVAAPTSAAGTLLPPGPSPAASAAVAAAHSGIPLGARYPVDLARLRRRLPNNIYWQLDAPTTDEATLRARAEEDRRWEELFGKVQSSTATDEEISAYFAHRRRVSQDYVVLLATLLAEHGKDLPDQDRGLYELGVTLHRARLKELPREEADAIARKQQQDARRAAWIRAGSPGGWSGP